MCEHLTKVSPRRPFVDVDENTSVGKGCAKLLGRH